MQPVPIPNKTNPLANCNICPRNCGIDRTIGQKGYCQAPLLPKVALVSKHAWEEPPISGTNGSGTVFFSHCNMKCVFCQNHTISQQQDGIAIPVSRLADIFLEQQARGCHNVNLVSGSHFIPQIVQALTIAKQNGLTIPVVYNSNGYESIAGLQLLEGLVDIYLPDFKYWDEELGLQYAHTPRYPQTTMSAILEMRRQIPTDCFDAQGILQRGIIIRHLILPQHYQDSCLILDWIKEHLGAETMVSLLNQYTPMYQANQFKNLSRRLTTFEYQKVTEHFLQIGLKNGFVQKRSSATSAYTPLFDGSGVQSADTCSEKGGENVLW